MIGTIIFPIKPRLELEYILPDIKFNIGDIVIAPLRGKPEVGVIVELSEESSLEIKKLKKVYGKLWDGLIIPYPIIKLTMKSEKLFLYSYGQFLANVFPVSTLGTKKKFVVISDNSLEFFKDILPFNNTLYALSVFERIFGRKNTEEWLRDGLLEILELKLPLPTFYWKDVNSDKVKKIPFLKGQTLNIEREIKSYYTLTDEQKNVYNFVKDSIEKNESGEFLIYGVTGSGKTELYKRWTEDVIKINKSVLILVPEIVLAEQIVKEFEDRFPGDVILLHSKLTKKQRFEAYIDILSGRKNIIIGARSAIWAPISNLGLIVIDEEHSENYHQGDMAPRYDAIEVAKIRASLEHAILVRGSATPSSQSFHDAEIGKLSVLKLTKRIGSGGHPALKLVEPKYGINPEILKAIEERLSIGEQVIVLYNRRGYARINKCDKCGYVQECKKCSVNLVFHKKEDKMKCHYCGYVNVREKWCPKCGSRLNLYGFGTEKVEEMIRDRFPQANIARLDQDTTTSRTNSIKILNDFKAGKIDILIGTQMVSKGFDIENVTMVAIVNADSLLMVPEFNGEERFLQMLFQTAGRSGRGNKRGEVYIETSNAEYVKELLERYDYYWALSRIMDKRKRWDFPPYVFMHRILWSFSSLNKKNEFESSIIPYIDKLEKKFDIKIIGPLPNFIERIGGFYREQVIVRGKNLKETLNVVKFIADKFNGYPDTFYK